MTRPSPRKLVRHGISNLLLGLRPASEGATVNPIERVGSRVYTNRPTPLWEVELAPAAICIWFHNETSNTDRDNSRRKYDREDTIYVEILTEGNKDCDDLLDDVAQEVEDILLAFGRILVDPVSKQELTDDFELKESRLELIGDETTMIVASLLMSFRVEYSTEIAYKPGTDRLGRVVARIGSEGKPSIASDNQGLSPEPAEEM